MCTKPPKPPKPVAPSPELKAPEIDLGSNPSQDARLLKRRGRSALRTGLTIDGSSGSALTVD